MKKTSFLLSFILLLCFSVDSIAVDLDRRPRKKRKKQRIEKVEEEDKEALKIEKKEQSEEPEKPQVALPVKEEKPLTDLELGYTPQQTDSLLSVWRERQRDDLFSEYFEQFAYLDTTIVDTTPDSIYMQRLRALASPIPLPFNSLVKSCISQYVSSRNGTMSRVLGRSQYYFPFIEEQLIKAGLPIELRSMAIIESALSPTAMSRVGAAGLWQFMPGTGRMYGLEINSLVDERLDPIRSTEAACRYLKDLYNIYNDWSLAIAAYNCGPGNINKAFVRSGAKERSFWEIYPWLLRETRGYLPRFIAANYAYAYHRQHGIEFTEPPVPVSVDTVHIKKIMHFQQISSTIDLPIETLRQLNPQYKLDIVPATTKTYALVLPQRCVAQYLSHEQEILRKDSMYLKEYINPANISKKKLQSAYKTYRVRRGDMLGTIARRHHVTVKQLMKWNHIRNPRSLRVGQRLKIYGR